MSRLATVRATLKMARERDPRFVPYVLLAFLGTLAVVFGIGLLLGSPVLFGVLAVLLALLAGMIVTGRRVSTAAFAGIEGQPGAAAAILSSMRGHWHVTPAVGMTRNQDFVHRVVGRPGVVLVAEGSGGRPRELVGNEARKLRRVIGDTPLYDVVVGDGEGQVPLKRLQMHVMKLPRNLTPREVNELEARLKAMGSMATPLPKGPIPKNLKPPRPRR
jgi:hypothetical protein